VDGTEGHHLKWKLARCRKLKAACFLSYVELDPIQIQQYYEKNVMLCLGEVTNGRGKVKEGS
jgi:hypothetical protein